MQSGRWWLTGDEDDEDDEDCVISGGVNPTSRCYTAPPRTRNRGLIIGGSVLLGLGSLVTGVLLLWSGGSEMFCKSEGSCDKHLKNEAYLFIPVAGQLIVANERPRGRSVDAPWQAALYSASLLQATGIGLLIAGVVGSSPGSSEFGSTNSRHRKRKTASQTRLLPEVAPGRVGMHLHTTF